MDSDNVEMGRPSDYLYESLIAYLFTKSLQIHASDEESQTNFYHKFGTNIIMKKGHKEKECDIMFIPASTFNLKKLKEHPFGSKMKFLGAMDSTYRLTVDPEDFKIEKDSLVFTFVEVTHYATNLLNAVI